MTASPAATPCEEPLDLSIKNATRKTYDDRQREDLKSRLENINRHLFYLLPLQVTSTNSKNPMNQRCNRRKSRKILPPNHRRNSDENAPSYRLFRGQQAWLNGDCSPLRQILRCLVCEESFDSLQDLTKHLGATKHYDPDQSDLIKAQQKTRRSGFSKLRVLPNSEHVEQRTSDLLRGSEIRFSGRCALDSLQEFVQGKAFSSALDGDSISDRLPPPGDCADNSTRQGNLGEHRFEKYRKLAQTMLSKRQRT